MRLVIAISGPVAVGKSAFIGEILQRVKGVRISTRELIQSLRPVPSERGPLQEAGDCLDRETDGKWVADALLSRARTIDDDTIIIVDSVRIPRQVEQLKAAYGDMVKHVHLTASLDVLSQRFMQRKQAGDPAVSEFSSYDEVRVNATEAGIGKLAEIADLVIDTGEITPADEAMIAIREFDLVSNN